MLSFGSPTSVVGARAAAGHVVYVAGMLRACGLLRGEAIDGSGGEMVVVQGQLLRHEEDSAAFATRIFDSIFPSGSMSAAADSDEFLLVQPRKEVLSRGGAKWAIPAARAASLDVTSIATTKADFIKGAAATIAAHGAINDA